MNECDVRSQIIYALEIGYALIYTHIPYLLTLFRFVTRTSLVSVDSETLGLYLPLCEVRVDSYPEIFSLIELKHCLLIC